MGTPGWSIWRTLLKLDDTPTSGAVAQLGERLVRNEEATGSIPVSSTMFPITCTPFLKIPFNKHSFYWNTNGTLGTERSTKARSCLTACF